MPTETQGVFVKAMVSSQAVVCDRTEASYGIIYYLGVIIVFVFGFVMSFLHWKVRVEYVDLWKKAIVGGIVVFYGTRAQAVLALVGLIAVQLLFGAMARFWAEQVQKVALITVL